MARGAYLLQLGRVPYGEAWALQRSLAGAVSQGAIPDTIVLLEHPPVVTLGRRADPGELHIPEDAEVEVVETDRGGKSTYHGPGQLVCYPILDLSRHGSDVRRYVRMLEEALLKTLGAFSIDGTRFEGDNMAGVWLDATRPGMTAGRPGWTATDGDPLSSQPPLKPPRKIASVGVHVRKWITTHGYALNVDLDTAPFTRWITACGLEGAAFTTMARELGRAISVDDVRPHATAALGEVLDLDLEELPAEDGAGLWPQPVHARLSGTR